MKPILVIAMALSLAAAVSGVTACSPDDRFTLSGQEPPAPGAGNEGDAGSDNGENAVAMKVRIRVGDRTVTAAMEDNAAGRDFLSRLPLEVTLNDYARAEKIFYPSPALATSGVARGCAPAPGDITVYVPWGNVAIFYKGGHTAET